jgi:hypothetical protein
LPIITGASGVLQVGSFGTTANTFCQGNDSRLSDARTPLAHTHAASDINSGTLDIARIPTGTTSTTVPLGNDSRIVNAQQPTFETVSQSLASLPHTISYSSGRVSTVVYTLPNASTITKTVNYTGERVSTIVLSGATPSGIQLTKTLTYTGDQLTGVAYS